MSKLILGFDAGNDTGKIVGDYGAYSFNTNICEWFVQDNKETFGEDDMEFEIDGRKGFAGSIAIHEDEFGGGSMFGDSKAHPDTKIRVLLGLYRYIKEYNLNVITVSMIVGQPFVKHNDVEKTKIKKMLEGYHDYTVNGENIKIFIERVEVVAEGAGAFWSQPIDGRVRIIDVGSGTVNTVTISGKKIIHKDSGTLNFGMETVKNKRNIKGIARGITIGTTTLNWNRNDIVYICGGAAEVIAPYVKEHYENIEVISPVVEYVGSGEKLEPFYANATGFYKIAKRMFI